MGSLATAMALFFSAIPKILRFLVILIVGWLVALLVEKAVATVLRTTRFSDLAKRAGLADFVGKMGADTDSAGVLGAVVKWFIRLIALVVAFDALGLPAVSDVLRQLLLWLPNVVVTLGIPSCWPRWPAGWSGPLPSWWRSTRSAWPPPW